MGSQLSEGNDPMNSKKPVAWITGGSSGIGYAVAEALARCGYRVVLSARGQDALRSAAQRISDGGFNADYVQMDTTIPAEVTQAHQTIISRHRAVDLLVNCAGFNVAARQWHELTVEDFERVIAGNLTGTFYTVNAVLPEMRKRQSGVIINVASIAGKVITVGGGVAYTVAKQGVITLTMSINMAEFRNGIRACVISPGETATPAMGRRSSPPTQEVLDRMLKPEDVAAAVQFAAQMPKHVAIHEIVISPTWNRAWV